MTTSRIVDPRRDQQLEYEASRSDGRRAERVVEDALTRLGADLATLSARRLSLLELPEAVEQAVLDYQSIKSAPAKNRQLRVVRGALRDADWASIRSRLDGLLLHGAISPPDAADDGALGWALRLVGEGPSGLDAFIALHPTADRAHLRQLIRAVLKASDERRVRAEKKLATSVRGFLR